MSNVENQNTEFKESWRDEYIKWIGGFANAEGGKLIIGVDDKGKAVGVKQVELLLEEIPNKVRDILGILVNVNLIERDNLPTIEIVTEAHPFPVSYKGSYFLRSGSTKQELKGNALDRFLLRKQGKRWDGVPIPGVTISDLSRQAFDYFLRKARSGKRLMSEMLDLSDDELLIKLHLKEGNYLKRAAILLFHPDPEKFVTGAYVKIGFFNEKELLVYQDEIHGYLFEQVEKTMDLLLTKYMKAFISYDGLHRIETYPFPETALREALLNAIAHKDYSGNTPIQISVYDHKIIFWNQGQLPETWTLESLTAKHGSVPYNPDIANAFFRASLIEAWGQGIFKMIGDCIEAKVPPPIFKYNSSEFVIEFHGETDSLLEETVEKTVEKTREKTVEKTREKTREKILKFIGENNKITVVELADLLGITSKGVEYQITKLKGAGIIDRIGPDKGGTWIIL
jgi:ATP-dependent DNA helicase RecG